MNNKQPRYKPGDIVYVHSRDDGWVQRKIVSVFPREWEYVLDKSVRIGKEFYVGSETKYDYFTEPAEESLLRSLGDLVNLDESMINKMENPCGE